VSSRPSGTLTLFFSDVEGSTQLVQRLGARYGELLARSRALIGSSVESAGGAVVDCRGDEFFVVFTSAPSAVAAAIAVQHAL
jgi:class 3 adenylate cyclase